MNRRRLFLISAVAILATLVVLDNTDLGLDRMWARLSLDTPRQAPAAEDGRLHALQRAVSSGDSIEQSYRGLAPRYAARAAELDTLVTEPGDPRQIALEAIDRRLRSIRHLTVVKAAAGEARHQGEGVALVSVSLELEAATHDAALLALLELSRSERGYAWQNLDLEADAEKKRIGLRGHVLTVIVESAE